MYKWIRFSEKNIWGALDSLINHGSSYTFFYIYRLERNSEMTDPSDFQSVPVIHCLNGPLAFCLTTVNNTTKGKCCKKKSVWWQAYRYSSVECGRAVNTEQYSSVCLVSLQFLTTFTV